MHFAIRGKVDGELPGREDSKAVTSTMPAEDVAHLLKPNPYQLKLSGLSQVLEEFFAAMTNRIKARQLSLEVDHSAGGLGVSRV